MKNYTHTSHRIARFRSAFVLLAILLAFSLGGCAGLTDSPDSASSANSASSASSPHASSLGNAPDIVTLDAIEEASGADLLAIDVSTEGYAEVNGNVPTFTSNEISRQSFEKYANLDWLGRCGPALASVSMDTMPTERRGEIYWIKPTGWHSSLYDFVEGESLYNRCHLIAYSLAAENDNDRNLITGTRQMNVAMIPFENEVADYIRETGNHVMYRVTPVFVDNELLARGVVMEALSVEDNGRGISFNVWLPNVQDGVEIDYATGDNWLADEEAG